jgi:hypothetical protein
MASVSYPAGLPRPQTSTVTPAERRALSNADRPREARNVQRDRLEYERITWPPMTIADCDTLLTWWRTTLIYGGAWFAATWPLPRGLVSAVRKLREQPRWQFVPGGFWRLSALCEIRGRGVEPAASQMCEGGYLENFDEGLDPYTITGGDVFSIISSTYGNALKVTGGAITAFGSTADRIIPESTFTRASFKVRLDAFPSGSNPDDGPFLELDLATVPVFLFDTSREAFFDGARRPYVEFNGSFVPVAPAALAVGVWHNATLEIVSPTSVEFTLQVVGGAVLQVTTFTGTFSTLAADQILAYDTFSFGGSDVKCSATFDEIELCP